MQLLRANTAVDVLIGPFVDDTDGKTAETGLTISQADVKLSKNGQTLAQKSDVTAAAHDADGYYNCELDATDTNTEGTMVLAVNESGALPVRHEFCVLSEAAWDSLFAAKDTGYMDVDVKAISTSATAADNLEVVYDTDFATNYNATRNAWATNVQDTVGSGNLPANAVQIEGSDATDQINAACDASIETYHLQYLFHTTYDPAGKPGQADALLNELVENDGGVSRFTANSLEQGPGGSVVNVQISSDQVEIGD